MPRKVKYDISLRPGQTLFSGSPSVVGEKVGRCTAVRRGSREHFRGRKPPAWIVDHYPTGMKVASCRKKRDCITAAKGFEEAGGPDVCATDNIKKLQKMVYKKPKLTGYGRYLWEHFVHGYRRPVMSFDEWKVR